MSGRLLQFPPTMAGDDVRQFQAAMAARGFQISVDGVYGPQSKDVCMRFQAQNGLVADGIVGPLTWAAISGNGVRTFGWNEIHRFVRSRLGSAAADPRDGQADRGDGSGSWHFRKMCPDGVARGHAVDYGDANSDCRKVWDLLLPFAQGPNAPIRELFFDPLGGWDEGKNIGAIGNHGDHVHAAIAVGAQLPQ